MRKEPIKIGVILPLSGEDELFGSQGVQGAKMAVAEINAAGGVLGGRHFELVIEDEQTNLIAAIRKTEKVILKDEVIAVMGPTSSAHRKRHDRRVMHSVRSWVVSSSKGIPKNSQRP